MSPNPAILTWPRSVAASGPTVLAYDTFTRADNTTIGSTEVGSFAWGVYKRGSDSIDGNTLYNSSFNNLAYSDNIETLVSDCTITCKVLRSGTTQWAGLHFRAADSMSSRWAMWLTGAEVSLRVYLNKTSSNVVDSFSINTSLDVWQELSVVLDGPSIKGYLNGSLVVEATDSYNETRTVHGVMAVSAPGARFDDFKVTIP